MLSANETSDLESTNVDFPLGFAGLSTDNQEPGRLARRLPPRCKLMNGRRKQPEGLTALSLPTGLTPRLYQMVQTLLEGPYVTMNQRRRSRLPFTLLIAGIMLLVTAAVFAAGGEATSPRVPGPTWQEQLTQYLLYGAAALAVVHVFVTILVLTIFKRSSRYLQDDSVEFGAQMEESIRHMRSRGAWR